MRFFILYIIAVATAAILGIDFGQQFTKAVLLAPGIQFELVLTDEGKRKDLSGLSIRPHPESKDELERVYGSATGSLCTRFPQSCILHLKSILGKSFSDLATTEYAQSHFVGLSSDESRSGSTLIDVGIQDEYFTAEEIVAMSLNNLRERAISDIEESSLTSSSRNKKTILDVAISIPPFASQQVRQSYLDILELANFTSVLGLIDDGTAVALNFLSNKKFTNPDELTGEREYHMIYDMGAGSTKATLFSFVPFKNGTIHLELENVGYDETFGGQLLTNSIYSLIKEKFLEHFKLSHNNNKEVTPKIEARILEAAEKAKLVLSVNAEYQVSLESIYKEKDFKTSISREAFEEINSDLSRRITQPILNAIKGVAGVNSIADVKSVVLAGGSTRVPFVQKHLFTLLNEEQISKNVNADESCAIGTTIRGFKLKTHLEKAKDIKVFDKAFHSYEFGLNSNDEQTVVFPRGSLIGNDTKVALANLSDTETLDITLYEDGHLIKTYPIDDLSKKGEKLKCKNKKDLKQIVGTFSLDNNKIFDLSKLEIECITPEKQKKSSNFIKNLLKKDTEEEEEEVEDEVEEDETVESETASAAEGNGSNSSNSTTKKSKPKAKLPIQPRPITISITKPVYSQIKPLSSTKKERISKRLSHWNSRDETRLEIDSVKNILEGQCYEFRSYLEDNEELLEKEITSLSDYTAFVGDVIEWLEFESSGSTLDHFKLKIKEINEKKKELDKIIQISKTDLTIDGLKKIYEEGSQVIMSIQGYLIEFGTEINEMRQKFEDEGFNFDKENDRIKLQLLGKSGGPDKLMSLDKTLGQYKEQLTKLGDIIDLDIAKFNRLSRDEVWEIYDDISSKIFEMLGDVVKVEEAHKDRITLFEQKLKTLLERKAQKEYREKLREEAAKIKKDEKAEKKAGEEDTEVVDEEVFERVEEVEEDGSGSSTVIEEDESKATKSEAPHDEL
ncbi:heat shock protein 70 homolog Lhs1p [[Candida] railenensis]|uniref:Heat shock protein 70 homolog Lhs1p n=1 Tax=[Candida] railenensis TaxID=45579 RepID=A0A9P0QNV2_9ASCO|nr:heat shock protein 70 homolog Lhs1p [[Candida] railenensis]